MKRATTIAHERDALAKELWRQRALYEALQTRCEGLERERDEADRTRQAAEQRALQLAAQLDWEGAQVKPEGFEFEYTLEANGDVLALTCRIFRKDRVHPAEVTKNLSDYPGVTLSVLRQVAFNECANEVVLVLPAFPVTAQVPSGALPIPPRA